MMMATPSFQQRSSQATKAIGSSSRKVLAVVEEQQQQHLPLLQEDHQQDHHQSPTAVATSNTNTADCGRSDGSRGSTDTYANPPFLPNHMEQSKPTLAFAITQQGSTTRPLHDPKQPDEKKEHPQQKPLVYVNRAKRAACGTLITSTTSAAVTKESALATATSAAREASSTFYSTSSVSAEAEAEARRHLRLSYIKSAARELSACGQTALPLAVMPATTLQDPDNSTSEATATPVTPHLQPSPLTQSPSDGQARKQTVTTRFAREPSPTSSATAASPSATGAAAASGGTDVFGQPVANRGVPHVYHDFSSVPDSSGYVRKKTGGVTQPFPEKLHELLEKESTEDFRENVHATVGWLPHGRAFLVRKPKEFTRDVMPKYFRQTKLTSFQRQLNLYGFRRITQGPDAGAYYHELFLRGRPQLCLRMVRQKVKGTGHKQPADAQTEPNFYALPPTAGSSALDSPTLTGVAAEQSPPSVPRLAPSSPQQHPGPLLQEIPLAAAAPIAPTTSRATSFSAMAQLEMSPGTQGVHGAASLLQGIAAGLAPSRMNSIKINPSSAVPYLGPPVDQPYDGTGTMLAGGPPSLSTTSAPAASQDRHLQLHPTASRSSYSTLLWGGGARAPSPDPSNPGYSFLWPPPSVPSQQTEGVPPEQSSALEEADHEEAV